MPSLDFMQLLRKEYHGVVPKRRATVRGGFPTETEIYENVYPDGGGDRFEISYDPSIGHVPRFARTITWDKDRKRALVREMYLVEA